MWLTISPSHFLDEWLTKISVAGGNTRGIQSTVCGKQMWIFWQCRTGLHLLECSHLFIRNFEKLLLILTGIP
jgi:hypothetical protein